MDILPEHCRLCLTTSEPTNSIYDRLSLAEITELLQDTLGIQISSSEEYTNICNSCEMKAKLTYNVYNEFRQADKTFCLFIEQKRASQGIPLMEESKDSISIMTVTPLEPISVAKYEVECVDADYEPATHQESERSEKASGTHSMLYSTDDDDHEDHDDIEISYQDQDDYTSDDEIVPSTKSLPCFICNSFSGNDRSLGNHLKEEHGALSPYYCEKCLVSIDDMMAINIHHQSHEFPFGCLFCEAMFATEEELSSHQISCNGYHCVGCSNHFMFWQNLKEHECKATKSTRMQSINEMIGHRRNQSRFIPLICGMCNEDMGKNNRLAQHFEKEHGTCQLQLHSCDVCSQKFTVLLAARLHRLSHKKDSVLKSRKIPAVEKNDCTICSRVFKFNKELLTHMETEHADAGIEFHQCHKCDKKFTSEAKLLKHDYNTHQGKQPQFFCSFCGRVFNKRLGLRDHENIHRGIKEYHCKECNKDFTYKSTYDRHMQVVHSDTKQFTCQYCHKSFKRKPTLKVHLRLHTGEKPYQCEYCSRRFVDPSSFHKHKQKEHGWKSKVIVEGF